MAVLWCRDGQLILDGTREERRPFEAADADFLNEQSTAYTRALTLRTPAGTLLVIGKALHDWLDRKDLLAQIMAESGPVSLDLAVAIRPDANARAFVVAPWELLTDASGLHLAFDATRAYSPARRFGAPGTPWEPAHRDLSVLFMAAAPEGVSDLDYEREEALILDAVERLPVQLAVEESGALKPLADRLALEGPFEVLHLTCHGDLDDGRGVLALEDDTGGLDLVTADRLCGAMGSKRPPLALVSACRSAEQAGAAVPLALALMEAGLPQVVGWAGSVYDSDAIVFARTLYEALGRRETVPAAAAIARRALVEALQRDPEGIGQHWHLARVHLGPNGGGPLCANNKPPRPRPLGDKPFLDCKRQVPVAAPAHYVGRRREAQAILRAFSAFDGPAGVLVRGMGRLGKSSLAARIARRRPDLRTAVVFGRYDARAIFDELIEAIDARHRAALRTAWLDAIGRDPQVLKDAIEAVLTGPAAAPDRAAGHQPILLVIDDLERILEPPRPGESRTLVKAEVRAPLKAVIEAFAAARTVTESRLLLTSRYTFSLPASRGDAADDLLDLQVPPLTEGQRRKLAWAELSRGRLEAAVSEEAEALAGRALKAAAGNPGLQALLTRPIPIDPSAADAAIATVEAYRASGAMPAGDVGQFFSELALTAYRDALTTDETRAMQAARAFTLPVPRAVMETAAGVLGVSEISPAVERLIGLGCLDIFGSDGKGELAANALAAPLFAKLEDNEIVWIARATIPLLISEWKRSDESIKDHKSMEIFRLAEIAGNAPDILISSARSAAAWMWFVHGNAKESLTIVERALFVGNRVGILATYDLLQIGIECARQLGKGELQDKFIECGTNIDHDPDKSAQARFFGRRGDRLLQIGHIEKAKETYTRACKLFEETRDLRAAAITMGGIADILCIQGKHDEALTIYKERMLPVFHQLRDIRSHAVTQAKIAEILYTYGDIESSLHIFSEEILPAFKQIDDTRNFITAKSRFIEILFAQGRIKESINIYRKDIRPFLGNLTDVRARSISLGIFAKMLTENNDLVEALDLYHNDILPTFERLGDVRSCAAIWGQIANIHFLRGDVDKAIRLREQRQLPVYEMLEDIEGLCNVHFHISQMRLAKGIKNHDITQSIIDSLSTAFRYAKKIGQAEAIALVGELLGMILSRVGLKSEALPVLSSSASAFRKLGREADAAKIDVLIAALPQPPADPTP